MRIARESSSDKRIPFSGTKSGQTSKPQQILGAKMLQTRMSLLDISRHPSQRSLVRDSTRKRKTEESEHGQQ